MKPYWVTTPGMSEDLTAVPNNNAVHTEFLSVVWFGDCDVLMFSDILKLGDLLTVP
jgi:hypothetical protein